MGDAINNLLAPGNFCKGNVFTCLSHTRVWCEAAFREYYHKEEALIAEYQCKLTYLYADFWKRQKCNPVNKKFCKQNTVAMVARKILAFRAITE